MKQLFTVLNVYKCVNGMTLDAASIGPGGWTAGPGWKTIRATVLGVLYYE